jgi:cytochrome c-type biogenesis protein CcmF
VFNNLLLTSACATVLIGTLYPLVLETLTGAKISVGAPYFNSTFVPMFTFLLVAVPFGPLLSWKRSDLLAVSQRLVGAFLAGGIGVLVTFAIEGRPLLADCAAGLGIFVIAGAVNDFVERSGLFRVSIGTAAWRAAGLPRSAWGTMFAHAGLGLTLLGIVGETAWGAERIASLRLRDSIEISGYNLTFVNIEVREGPNYREQIARFAVSKDGKPIADMRPSKRAFSARDTTTTEAALLSRGLGQLYLSLGDPSSDGGIQIRLYYKPLVLLIWIGALVMAFGGALSFSDRRLRVGTPKLAKNHPAMQLSK